MRQEDLRNDQHVENQGLQHAGPQIQSPAIENDKRKEEKPRILRQDLDRNVWKSNINQGIRPQP